MIEIIILFFFFLSSIIHLIFCFVENEKLRKITKPFCLAFLTILIIAINYRLWPIYIGTLCGLIGDICLLKKKDMRWFGIGTIFFLVEHAFYLGQFIALNKPFFNQNFYIYILATFGFLISFVLCYLFLPKRYKYLDLLGYVYISILATNIIFGFAAMFNFDLNIASSLCFFIGYLFFFASDSILIWTSFFKDFKRRDFYIMLLYLTAQLFIVFALFITIL